MVNGLSGEGNVNVIDDVYHQVNCIVTFWVDPLVTVTERDGGFDQAMVASVHSGITVIVAEQSAGKPGVDCLAVISLPCASKNLTTSLISIGVGLRRKSRLVALTVNA